MGFYWPGSSSFRELKKIKIGWLKRIKLVVFKAEFIIYDSSINPITFDNRLVNCDESIVKP
jgi:hypothetical protein